MAISSAICNTFKRDLLKGFHDFDSSGGDTFKIALYTSSASLGATTTAYSTSNEISNSSGSAYSAGGLALTNNGVTCLLYTSPSPRDRQKSRMPSSA